LNYAISRRSATPVDGAILV